MSSVSFDLVVRNGRVIDAGRVVDVDIGIEAGRVRELRAGLGPGEEDIDAGGQMIMPGGVDSHVHLRPAFLDG